MNGMNEWKDRLFYMARASTASIDPKDAAELLSRIEQLEKSRIATRKTGCFPGPGEIVPARLPLSFRPIHNF